MNVVYVLKLCYAFELCFDFELLLETCSENWFFNTATTRQETASLCHFHHKQKEVWILVHGDDFVVVSRRHGREHIEATLRGHGMLSQSDGT